MLAMLQDEGDDILDRIGKAVLRLNLFVGELTMLKYLLLLSSDKEFEGFFISRLLIRRKSSRFPDFVKNWIS